MLTISRNRGRLAVGLAAAAAILGACAASTPPADDPGPTGRPVRTDAAIDPLPSESTPAVLGEVPERLLDEILADAADRAAVDVDALEVTRAEAVTWNDGSLGCPEPGMLYTQALVDGYHVVVAAGDTELDYRATANGTFRLCPNPAPSSGG
jgi:hypothetical protein